MDKSKGLVGFEDIKDGIWCLAARYYSRFGKMTESERNSFVNKVYMEYGEKLSSMTKEDAAIIIIQFGKSLEMHKTVSELKIKLVDKAKITIER